MNMRPLSIPHHFMVFLGLSLMLTLTLMLPLTISFASVDPIETLNLNQEYNLAAPTTPYDTTNSNRLKTFHYKSYAPYVTVYQLQVTPGQRYTFKVIYPGDKKYGNVELLGANPLSTQVGPINNAGAIANIIGFSGSIETLKAPFTYSTNFTINSAGNSSTIYLIAYFDSPSGSLKVSLNQPATSDALVEKASADGLSWGTALTDPLQLTALSNMKLNLKIGSKTATINSINESLDVAPFLVSGSSVVPLRYIGEKLGATVDWNATDQMVTYTTDTVVIKLWINNKNATVNGVQKAMTIAPTLVNGRTVVPLRFVSENLGAKVEWFGATQEIIISK